MASIFNGTFTTKINVIVVCRSGISNVSHFNIFGLEGGIRDNII